ncbi:MAG: S-layer homology domain-containing protein [Clostridia bacterium]|nr:S-layer homology domain-containing protein [Clostridia bacterium]
MGWAVQKGIVGGYTDGSIKPGASVTRAQAAVILTNFVESSL